MPATYRMRVCPYHWPELLVEALKPGVVHAPVPVDRCDGSADTVCRLNPMIPLRRYEEGDLCNASVGCPKNRVRVNKTLSGRKNARILSLGAAVHYHHPPAHTRSCFVVKIFFKPTQCTLHEAGIKPGVGVVRTSRVFLDSVCKNGATARTNQPEHLRYKADVASRSERLRFKAFRADTVQGLGARYFPAIETTLQAEIGPVEVTPPFARNDKSRKTEKRVVLVSRIGGIIGAWMTEFIEVEKVHGGMPRYKIHRARAEARALGNCLTQASGDTRAGSITTDCYTQYSLSRIPFEGLLGTPGYSGGNLVHG